ncbi:MAG: FtsH protease activity modulator HflK [Chloroflexi bacterium]|nr:FtsH protease activity modulator HflK [Chloroflexota bacterium]
MKSKILSLFQQRPQQEIDLDELFEKIKSSFSGGFGGFSPKIGRFFIPGIILALILVWAATGLYRVEPSEQAAEKLLGSFTNNLRGPGLHWFWPAPIGQVQKEVVTETKRLEVGFRTGPGGAIQDVGEEALMITGDLNLVDVQLIVQYRIGDLGAYLYNVDDPGSPDREIREGAPDGLTILDATEASLRQVVGQRSVDDILTTNKEAVQTDTLLMLQEMLNSYETGIDVLEVRLQNVRPPDEVREDFDDVVRARVDKESVINAALAYEQDQLPKARGDAEKVTNAAQAYKEERILKATGEANRFSALLGEYEKSKEVTRQRLYLEAMEEVLPGVKKYVLDPENEGNLLQFLPLNESSSTTP